MNLAVLPDYSSTRVVAFVVTVFFGPSPSSKLMIFAMASGHSFPSFWPPFLAFLLLKYYNFFFPTLCRLRQKWTPRPWRPTLSSQKTFTPLFLVFGRVELGHSIVNWHRKWTENTSTIHRPAQFKQRKMVTYHSGGRNAWRTCAWEAIRQHVTSQRNSITRYPGFVL